MSKTTIPNPIEAAKEQRYQDMLDLLDYAQDHMDGVRGSIGAAMTGEDIDIATARITYAIRRLDQLAKALFDADDIG